MTNTKTKDMDNGRVYVGIDPGSLGFVAVMYPNGDKDFLSIKDAGHKGIVEFLKDVFVASGGDLVCCMEEVHAIMGSSAKSTFCSKFVVIISAMLRAAIVSVSSAFR